MAMIDNALIFGEDVAVTSTGALTNIINTELVEASLGGNRHGAGYVNIHITTALAGTSCSLALQDCATSGGTYADVAGCSVVITGAAVGDVFSVKIPTTKQYLRVNATASSMTAGKATVYIGAPEGEH